MHFKLSRPGIKPGTFKVVHLFAVTTVIALICNVIVQFGSLNCSLIYAKAPTWIVSLALATALFWVFGGTVFLVAGTIYTSVRVIKGNVKAVGAFISSLAIVTLLVHLVGAGAGATGNAYSWLPAYMLALVIGSSVSVCEAILVVRRFQNWSCAAVTLTMVFIMYMIVLVVEGTVGV